MENTTLVNDGMEGLAVGTWHDLTYRGRERKVFVLGVWGDKLHVLDGAAMTGSQRDFLAGQLEAAQDSRQFYGGLQPELKAHYRTYFADLVDVGA